MGSGGGLEGTGRARTAVIGKRQTAGGVCVRVCVSVYVRGLYSMQLYSVSQAVDPSKTVTLPLSLSLSGSSTHACTHTHTHTHTAGRKVMGP